MASPIDLHVRPAAPTDADTIVQFQLRMAMETEGLCLDGDVVALGVAAVFGDQGKGQYWVAQADGQVVGCMMTTPEWSDWRNGTVLWIQSLYVPPEFRRRGVFRAMYEHVRGVVLAGASLKGLRLYVDAGNASAQATYQAMGMDAEHYRMYEWMKSAT
jgi:GNAT superfamily N-acetyltransferase